MRCNARIYRYLAPSKFQSRIQNGLQAYNVNISSIPFCILIVSPDHDSANNTTSVSFCDSTSLQIVVLKRSFMTRYRQSSQVWMDKTTLMFMPIDYGEKRSQRESELVQSSVRSHLAKLQHRRRIDKTETKQAAIKRRAVAFVEPTSRARYSAQTIASKLKLPEQESLELYRPNTMSTVCSDLDNSDTIRLLQCCTSFYWPGYDVGSAAMSHSDTFMQSWTAFTVIAGSSRMSPVYFHAMLYSCAAFLSHQNMISGLDQEGLRQKQLAVKQLKQDFKQGIQFIDESAMFGMLALCCDFPNFKLFPNSTKESACAFNPVFTDLQWLSINGRQPFNPIHLSAIHHLVKLKGGIHMIEMPSLRGALQYTDIVQSTLHLRAPVFPFTDGYEELAKHNTRENWYGLESTIRGLPSLAVFQNEIRRVDAVKYLASHELAPELEEMMLDLRLWSLLTDCLSIPKNRAYLKHGDLSHIGICRNVLQYRLLSTTMPLENKTFNNTSTSVSGADVDIADLVKTALVLVSVGFTFPVSYSVTFQFLTRRLRVLIIRDRLRLLLLDPSLYPFFTWACMLGCLSATQCGDFRNRDWFVDILCRLEEAQSIEDPISSYKILRNVRSWTEVRQNCLQPFIWQNGACDLEASKIWQEVQDRISSALPCLSTVI